MSSSRGHLGIVIDKKKKTLNYQVVSYKQNKCLSETVFRKLNRFKQKLKKTWKYFWNQFPIIVRGRKKL